MGGDFLLHRCARRTLLSRLGAEPARTPGGAPVSASDRFGSLRTVTLQQTLGAFQLALCIAGHHRGDLLWTSVARTAARASLGHHPCQRRLDMGALVLRAGDHA